MATTINPSLNNFLFDLSYDPRVLGRLKLPYKSFNFLAILSRNIGSDKYDRAVEIIELCHWIYNQVSDVRNIINRLAEYAITDLQIDDTHTKLNKEEQETLLRTLEVVGLKPMLVEFAKLYFATGNVFVSTEVRFKKHFKCPKCKTTYPGDSVKFDFDTKKCKFKCKCLKDDCRYYGYFDSFDVKKRRPEDINIKVWDWHEMEFTYNPISDEYRYYHKLPRHFTEKLLKGRPDSFLLLTTPEKILKEIFLNNNPSIYSTQTKAKMVGFAPGTIKHIKRPSTITSVMEGWGEPVTMGVLQDSFFMMLLRQAQAVLLTDYILPIRIVSPAPGTEQLMDLSQFAQHFDKIYDSFQKDPMQIFKVPFPIQYQTLSGEAKKFFLSNELDYTRQAIRRGIGLPAELLDGGLQNYSAGSISLRLLENYFINFSKNVITDLVNNFIIPQICVILEIPPFRAEMAKFKMIDDINQKQSFLDLFDRHLISDTQLYDQFNIDRPSQKELNDSIDRQGQRDGIYQISLAEASAEGQSIIAEKTITDQFRFEDMQTKNKELSAAKQTEESGGKDPNSKSGGKDSMVGNMPGAKTPTGEDLPPPEQLSQTVLAQLSSPEEVDNFVAELQKKLPGNAKYITDLRSSLDSGMRANMIADAQDKGKNSMTQIQSQAKNKPKSKSDRRPPSEQKPQQRDTPV